MAATHVRKECAGLLEENAITARALEQETKRARKEEYGRNKFRGALWGSNNEQPPECVVLTKHGLYDSPGGMRVRV